MPYALEVHHKPTYRYRKACARALLVLYVVCSLFFEVVISKAIEQYVLHSLAECKCKDTQLF